MRGSNSKHHPPLITMYIRCHRDASTSSGDIPTSPDSLPPSGSAHIINHRHAPSGPAPHHVVDGTKKLMRRPQGEGGGMSSSPSSYTPLHPSTSRGGRRWVWSGLTVGVVRYACIIIIHLYTVRSIGKRFSYMFFIFSPLFFLSLLLSCVCFDWFYLIAMVTITMICIPRNESSC